MFNYDKSILKLTETNEISYLQFNKLLEFQDKVLHFFTLKNNDIGFKWDKPEIRIKSLLTVSKEFNINRNNIIQLHQSHTSDILTIYKDDSELSPGSKYEDLDGLITNRANVMSLITTADCIGIIMYDPKNNVIANIHAGWVGVVKRIMQNAVEILKTKFNSKNEDILCFIEPSIRKECFLVNEDVVDIYIDEFSHFTKKNPIIEKTDLTNEKGVQYRIDNVLLTKLLLQERGVSSANIYDSKICNMCNANYFHSKRAEGDDFNNNGSFVMLK